MSVTAFKALSIVRNSQTRSGPCLKIFKRNYSNNPKPSESGLKVPESESHVNPLSSLGGHKVGKFERYFLVWTKKFKSLDDVPAYVSRDMMEKSRNIMRIRTNLSIMVLVIIGSIIAAQMGKHAAEKGESITKSNLEWHKKYNESKAN